MRFFLIKSVNLRSLICGFFVTALLLNLDVERTASGREMSASRLGHWCLRPTDSAGTVKRSLQSTTGEWLVRRSDAWDVCRKTKPATGRSHQQFAVKVFTDQLSIWRYGQGQRNWQSDRISLAGGEMWGYGWLWVIHGGSICDTSWYMKLYEQDWDLLLDSSLRCQDYKPEIFVLNESKRTKNALPFIHYNGCTMAIRGIEMLWSVTMSHIQGHE